MTVVRVWPWRNGMVMAFDENGEQVSAYQGRREDVEDRIRADFPDARWEPTTDWRTGAQHPMTINTIGVGDVLAVDSGTLVGGIVEFGERLLGQPHLVSHVIIAHHQDKRGTWWGLQGQPGGVGWVQLDTYLDSARAAHDNSNWWQPRDDVTRAKIARTSEGMLGVGYDWVGGIVADLFGAIKARELAELMDQWWGWQDPANPHARPGHVMCSAYASWIYGNLDLAHPESPGETTTPGQWWLYNHHRKD